MDRYQESCTGCGVRWINLLPGMTEEQHKVSGKYGRCPTCIRDTPPELLAASQVTAEEAITMYENHNQRYTLGLASGERVAFRRCVFPGGDWVTLLSVAGLSYSPHTPDSVTVRISAIARISPPDV